MSEQPDRLALATTAFETYRHLVPDDTMREFISALSGQPQPGRGPLTVQDPLEYVYILGHDHADQHVVLPAHDVLDEVQVAVAVSCAGTWGRFAKLKPRLAEFFRAELQERVAWKTYEDYREAYLAHGEPRPGGVLDDDEEYVDDADETGAGASTSAPVPAPTEEEIRAKYEELSWDAMHRMPLDSDSIDLGTMVQLGWDNRISMRDPFTAMEYALPTPIVEQLMHSFHDMGCNGPFISFNDGVCSEHLHKAFERLGYLLVDDDPLMSGFWDGIKRPETAQELIDRYSGRDQHFRNLIAALSPSPLQEDDPAIFEGLFDEDEEEEEY